MSDLLHVSAADLPATQSVTSFLAMVDQEGGSWYLWVNDAPAFVLSREKPDGIDLASRQTFTWLYWPDTLGRFWYLWPSTFGSVFFSPERPAGIGTGTVFSTWWSPGRQRWTVSLSPAPDLIISGEGAIVPASDFHTIMACRRCGWCGHVDRSNARRDRDGNPLLDRCPRDGVLFYPEDEDGEAA